MSQQELSCQLLAILMPQENMFPSMTWAGTHKPFKITWPFGCGDVFLHFVVTRLWHQRPLFVLLHAGGDGGQLREAPKMKKMVKRCPAAYSMQPCAAAMFGAPQYQMAADYDGGGPAFACCAPAVGGFGLGRQVLEAGTPVLSFLAQPAAVLTQLQLGPGGSLHIGPDKLGQLLAGGAVGGSGSGSDVGVQEGGDAGADAASGVDVLAKLGCRVVYAAVYDVKTPGQFGAAWAACEEQGDLGASQRQQQQAGGARAAAACSCLPDAAVRDMGLDRPVDPGVVVALVSTAKGLCWMQHTAAQAFTSVLGVLIIKDGPNAACWRAQACGVLAVHHHCHNTSQENNPNMLM